MSVENLLHFRENNVVVYAPPSHTSGKTQLCDVTLFGSFKQALNMAISVTTDFHSAPSITPYHFCSVLRTAFCATSNQKEISAAFEKAGLFPVNKNMVMNTPRPLDGSEILDVEKMEELYIKYRKRAWERF